MESRSNSAIREPQNAAKTLTSDIVFEILLQLRVKLLLRFCCVSKSWLALIFDLSFRRCHHQRSKQNPILLLTTTHRCTRYTHYSLDHKKERSLECLFKSVDLEDGLGSRLIVPTCTDLVCMYDRDDVYIVNPAMRRQIMLPKNSSAYVDYLKQMVAFGYVASTSEYVSHVTRFFGFYSACEVFTLGGSNSWRPVKTVDELNLLDDITMIDGSVYLLSQLVYKSRDCIFRFDLEKKSGQSFRFQRQMRKHHSFLCRGALSYMVGKRFEIWMQKDHCKDDKHCSWVEYSINISILKTARGVYPLAIEGNGRVVLWSSKFLYYDPKSKSF